MIGLITVEFFVLPDGSLVVNELAPRPHNSGHHTLETAMTSQFVQHVRAVCGLPLGPVELRSSGVMLNLLGDLWGEGEPDWELLLGQPNLFLHLYGKIEAKPGRKMGHFTLLGEGDSVTQKALSLRRKISQSTSRLPDHLTNQQKIHPTLNSPSIYESISPRTRPSRPGNQ